jgi:uncharacterized protein YbcI
MGRSSKEIRPHLIGDLLGVRLKGVLTAAEQQLVKSLPSEKGRDLLKLVRTHLIETARPFMEPLIQEATGMKVVSLHHDISTITGEEVILLTLNAGPPMRERRPDGLGKSSSPWTRSGRARFDATRPTDPARTGPKTTDRTSRSSRL